MPIFLNYTIDLNEHLKKLSLHPSPSEIIGSSEKLLEVFGGDQPNIHLGRPGGAPAVIFNPALAALQQRLDHLEQIAISGQEVDRAANYFRCAVQFFKDEKQRQGLIKDLVDRAVGKTGNWECPVDCGPSKIKPDGSWWHDVFLVLVLGLKNTLGVSGDAIYQSIIDYIKIVSRDKVQYPVSAASNPALTFVCSTSSSGSIVTSLLFLSASPQIASKSPSPFA